MFFKFKVLFDVPIDIGSFIKYKQQIPLTTGVGEVIGKIGFGTNIKYEIILLNKRLKPIMRGDDTYKKRVIHNKYCKHISIKDTIFKKQTFEIGDIVCNKFLGLKRYGIITGFINPDGLESKSYYDGYNGTDLIECVCIENNGLTRQRNSAGIIKRFISKSKRLKLCEVDLWDEKGVLIK